MRQPTAPLYNQRKTAWTWSWALSDRISPHPFQCQHMRYTRTWASRWKLLGRITNQSCTSTAPSRQAEIGVLELYEIGRWCSVHRHCLLSTTGHGWYCFHDGKSFMKVRQPIRILRTLLTNSFFFVCLFSLLWTLPFVVSLFFVAGWRTVVASLQHYFGGYAEH